MKNKLQNNEYIGVGDFAKKFGLSPVTVRRYIKSGKLKANRIGKKYHIHKIEVDRFGGNGVNDNASELPKVFTPQVDLKSNTKYNSIVSETLVEIATDFSSIDEIVEVIRQLDRSMLFLVDKIEKNNISPVQFISNFLKLEAEMNLKNRREMVKLLQQNKAVVFLPLPPNIFETVITSVSSEMIFNSEDKEPSHILGHNIPKLASVVDVMEKCSDVEAVVLDGKIIGNDRLIIRDNVASIFSFLMRNKLKKVFLHRIPHLPKGQSFVKLPINRSVISILFI